MTPRRTPDWLLERIASGALPADELARAREALLAEPDGAQRLAAIEASNAELLAQHPPEQVASEVGRRMHLARTRAAHAAKPRRPWLSVALGVPVAAALAVLFVVMVPAQEGELRKPGGSLLVDGERSKGLSPSLRVYRKTPSGFESLKSGATARAGEVLQVEYVPAGHKYGVIFSIDGSGAVTRHLPVDGTEPARLESTAASRLPHAYELDDAPAFERFFFVSSEEPFSLTPVFVDAHMLANSPERARTAPLVLPPGVSQSSLLVEKSP